jgi:hypothetical protein
LNVAFHLSHVCRYHQSYQEGHYVSSITTGQKNASNDSPRAQPVSSKRPSVAEPTKSDFAPPRSRNASVSINQQPQRAIQASEVLKQSANSLREVKQRAFDEMQNEVEQKEQVVQQINEEEQGSNEAAEQIKEEAHVVQQVLEAPEAVLGQSNDPNAMVSVNVVVLWHNFDITFQRCFDTHLFLTMF